jgi:hypothetical protein
MAGSAFAEVAMAAVEKIRIKKQERLRWPMSPVKSPFKASSSTRLKSPCKSGSSKRLSLPTGDRAAKENVADANAVQPQAANVTGKGEAARAVKAAGGMKRTNAVRQKLRSCIKGTRQEVVKVEPKPALDPELRGLLERVASLESVQQPQQQQ